MDGSKKVVRNIPIWIEGRDEPIINKDFDEVPSQSNIHHRESPSQGFAASSRRSFTPPRFVPHSHDMPDHSMRQSYSPQPNSHSQFNSAAAAPSPSSSSDNVTRKTQSTDSVKEIPIKVAHSVPAPSTAPSSVPPPQISQEQKQLESSIEKIQTIQSSVLSLMKKIEEYNGDRKDYLYLDEMLTQNLIKLDNIDTSIDVDGKENIKNARREAIKCINSLIQLLEEKKEGFENTKDEQKAM